MTVRWRYFYFDKTEYDPAWVKFVQSIEGESVVDHYQIDAALEQYNGRRNMLQSKHEILFRSQEDLTWFLLRWS